MRHLYIVGGLAAGALGGCESVADGLVDARRSDGRPAQVIQVSYDGSYTTHDTWDLSRPLGGDGLGGVIADLLVDEIVSLAGVPGALADEAHDAIAGRIRAPIVTYVNGAIPANLLPSSPTMTALAATLAAVTVNRQLGLSPSGDYDRCTGADIIDNMSVVSEDTTYVLDLAAITGGALTITSTPFAGTATGADTMRISDHDLQLYYGNLVAQVADRTLGVDAFALAATAWAGVSCPTMVDRFTSGAGFSITVSGQGYAVSDSALESACASFKAMLAEHALGMLARDAGVRIGGAVRFPAAGQIASEPGHGGVITLFPVVQPQLTITFTGERR